jgi:hypothetical protein
MSLQASGLQEIFETLRHPRARASVLVLEVIVAWPDTLQHNDTLALGTAPYQASRDQQFHISRGVDVAQSVA